ncbi:MAG: hypothetical protein SFY67_15840 [Candidatus Melainabacteria bacterium]|nr:hypothetical protein [Candidatus Melainabacteria bacterium]
MFTGTIAKLTGKQRYLTGFKEPPAAPLNLYQWLVRLSSNTVSVNGYGLVMVLLCFHQSLNCYFLADDFMHLNYLKQVFAGNYGLLLQNFWSTWLQTQGTSFYRPLISLTLAVDFLFWQYSAWGFHLSNLLFYFFCAIGVYLIAKELDNRRYSGSFPLVACTLFLLFPLHTEVASWIIARVDSVCACFFFLSFYYFLKHLNSQKSKVKNLQTIASAHQVLISISFFIFSLLSKEMAVVLPLTLSFYLLIFPTNNKSTLFLRLQEIFKQTYKYWLVLLIYLVVRTLSLGSFVGGYQGSLADSSVQDFLHRFVFNGGWQYFFYPYNHEILQSAHKLNDLTSALYASITLFFGICIFAFKSTMQRSLKLLLFCCGWFALSLLPAITVWNLTANLSGARFAFLASAPFCLALALMISVPVDLLYKNQRLWEKISSPTRILLTTAVSILFLASVMLNFYASRENNLAWLQASQEVRALKLSLEKESKDIGPDKNLALLNIPNRYAGAHMLYNGSMLYIMLQPPLVDRSLNLSERVQTFESALFDPSDLLNYARLERMSRKPELYNIYFWNRKDKELNRLQLDSNMSNQKIPELVINKQIDLSPGKIAGSPIVDIKSSDYKFIELKDDTHNSNSKQELALTWTSPQDSKINLENAIIADYNPRSQSYIFPLSEHKSWFLTPFVHRFFIVIASGDKPVRIKQLRLFDGCEQIAKLDHHPFKDGYLGPDGIFYLSPKVSSFKLDYDVKAIPNAKAALLEISKPNNWFEHQSHSFRDSAPCQNALLSKNLTTLDGTVEIETEKLATPGYYEVRVAAVDANKNVTGYFSDPLVIQLK